MYRGKNNVVLYHPIRKCNHFVVQISEENLSSQDMRDDALQIDISLQSGLGLPLINSYEHNSAMKQRNKCQCHKKHSIASVGPIDSIIDRSRATTYR